MVLALVKSIMKQSNVDILGRVLTVNERQEEFMGGDGWDMGGWRKLTEGFDKGGEGGRVSKMGGGDGGEVEAGWDTTLEEGGGREAEEGWGGTLVEGVGRENCSAACQNEGEEGIQVKKGLANLVISDTKVVMI